MAEYSAKNNARYARHGPTLPARAPAVNIGGVPFYMPQKINKGMGSFGHVALGYTKLASEHLDAFPSQKHHVTVQGLEEALDSVEGGTQYAGWEEEDNGKR